MKSTNSRFLRFLVRSVPLLCSLMLTHNMLNLESGSQIVFIVSGDNDYRQLLMVDGRTWPTFACFFVECGYDK